jgi:hypothetical protein
MTIGVFDSPILCFQGGVIPAPKSFPYNPTNAVSNPRGTVAALSKDMLGGI